MISGRALRPGAPTGRSLCADLLAVAMAVLREHRFPEQPGPARTKVPAESFALVENESRTYPQSPIHTYMHTAGTALEACARRCIGVLLAGWQRCWASGKLEFFPHLGRRLRAQCSFYFSWLILYE